MIRNYVCGSCGELHRYNTTAAHGPKHTFRCPSCGEDSQHRTAPELNDAITSNVVYDTLLDLLPDVSNSDFGGSISATPSDDPGFSGFGGGGDFDGGGAGRSDW